MGSTAKKTQTRPKLDLLYHVKLSPRNQKTYKIILNLFFLCTTHMIIGSKQNFLSFGNIGTCRVRHYLEWFNTCQINTEIRFIRGSEQKTWFLLVFGFYIFLVSNRFYQVLVSSFYWFLVSKNDFYLENESKP